MSAVKDRGHRDVALTAGIGSRRSSAMVFLAAALLMIVSSFIIVTESNEYASADQYYTISFDANGGEGSMDPVIFSFNYGGTLPANTFTREHYSFVNWNTEPDGSGISYGDGYSGSINNNDNTTLYAQWKGDTTDIYLDKNGGSGDYKIIASYGSPLPKFTNIVRTGHTLTGYYTEAVNGVLMIDKDGVLQSNIAGYSDADGNWIYTGAEDITLYAHWTPCTYQLTLNRNEGDMDRTATVTYGEKTVEPFTNVKYKGHTLLGYKTNGGDILLRPDGTFESDIGEYTDDEGRWIYTRDLTLTAEWKVNTYTITFDGNGSTYGETDDLQMTYGDLTKTLPANGYERTGYDFASWNEERDGSGRSWTDGAQVNKNLTEENGATITFYAQWTARTYTFVLGQNAYNGTNGEAVAVYGSNTLLSIRHAICTGYSVEGYYNDRTGGTLIIDKDGNLQKDTPYTDSNGNWDYDGVPSDIQAHWTANTYTIRFDSNGGTGGTMEDLPMTYGVSKELPKNAFTKEGNSFVHWKDITSGKEYDDGATVSNLSSADGSSVTLRAVWTATPKHTAKFLGGEGSAGTGPADISAYENTTITIPECTYTKEGYMFINWSLPDGTRYDPGDSYLLKSDVSFTAEWYLSDNYVVYVFDGEIAERPSKVTAGTEVTVIPKCTKTGYDVSDWSTDDVTVTEGKFRMPDHSVIFYSESSLHTYTITLNGNGASEDGSAKAQYNGFASDYNKVTRTGYELNGYYVQGSSDALKVMSADGVLLKNVEGYTDFEGRWIRPSDATLYANWVVEKHTVYVRYNYSDGTEAHADQSVNCDYGKEYSIESPMITGYTADKEKVSGIMGTKDIDVTVVYTANKYTITFDSAGGSSVASITQYYDTPLTAPADPTKADHKFYSWQYEHKNFSFTDAKMPAQDVTLTAVWSSKPVNSKDGTVTFSDNTDDVVIDKNDVETNQAINGADVRTIVIKGKNGWTMSVPKSIVSSAEGIVNASAWILSDTEKSTLPKAFQSKNVFSLRMLDSKETDIAFKGNKVTVTLSYTLGSGVSAEDLRAYSIDGEKASEISVSYDAETKTVTFDAEHFSYWYIEARAPSATDDGMNVGLIVGIVIAVIAVIGIGVYILKKKGVF